jgi:hypothetical protein
VRLERLDDLRRKPFRVQRERALDQEAHHLPVARCRVFPRGELEGLPAGAGRAAAARRLEQGEKAERLQVRKRSRNPVEGVAEGVRTRVAVGGRIGRGADAEAIADEDDYAAPQVCSWCEAGLTDKFSSRRAPLAVLCVAGPRAARYGVPAPLRSRASER